MRAPARVLLGVGAAVGLLVLTRCSFGIDPDQGHFSCVTVADCADGQACVPQADGGNGLCYPVGECVAEICNGKDDDCDGVVDDHDPCGSGAACVDAGCVERACANGLDDDDNGLTDCADPACVGAACVSDGGPERCVPKVLLADGGVVDAGTGTTVYRCDLP
jgi:hypothetical protein